MEPAHDRHSIGPHQELFEVPADVMDLHGIPEEIFRRAQKFRGGRTGVLEQRYEKWNHEKMISFLLLCCPVSSSLL